MLNKKTLNSSPRLHFVGIGGSGMFPIVQIMQSRGFTISGSDNNESDTLSLVRNMGIKVYLGHDANNIEGADMLVYSAAINRKNPEIVAAKAAKIPVVKRADMLGFITHQFKNCICVSGTHGKTSTTALLTQILINSDKDPTAVIGGKLPMIGGNGRAGASEIMTCEACEYQDTFLKLCPDISIILNIDEDHLEYFKTLENIIASFRKFAQKTTKTIIVNGDDQNSLQAILGLNKSKKIITFGFGTENDYYPDKITSLSPTKSTFVLMRSGKKIAKLELNIPGRHNILNTLAACAAAIEVGCSPAHLTHAVPGFTGAGRRFEVLGYKNGVTIVDDYAHHPTELKATLEVAMNMGYKKVWAVFQPFTYSRTAILLKDFADALSIADHVVMSEIMGAREENTYNIYTQDLANLIPGSVWFPTFEEIEQYVMRRATEDDLVITLGCGDIYKCAKMMLLE